MEQEFGYMFVTMNQELYTHIINNKLINGEPQWQHFEALAVDSCEDWFLLYYIID